MRPLAHLLGVFLCASSFTCSSSPPIGTSGERTLVILHTTDEHSHLLGFGPELDDYPAPTTAGTGAIRGGVGRRMTLLGTERQRAQAEGASSITVSAGDSVMGTLAELEMTAHAPDGQAMRLLGYDAGTFGNHAFDYGPGALAESLDRARASGGAVPIVMSNIHFSATDPGDDALAALFDDGAGDPSRPVHRAMVLTASNGLRVGLIGIMGASAASYATGKAPVTFSVPPGGDEGDHAAVLQQIVSELQPVVDGLRDVEHVDLVVALSHAGLDATGGSLAGEDVQIAQTVAGIDVLVSGHTHQVVPLAKVTNATTGAPVYVQQAGQFGEYVGRIVVHVDESGAVSVDEGASTILTVDDSIVPDPSLEPIVNDAILALESEKRASGRSFLEEAVTEIGGVAVADDPSRLGDLYFWPLGQTTFDLRGTALRTETPLMVLSADAMLAAGDAYGGAVDVAVQAQGLVFADLQAGRTGRIALGDVFRVHPLGMSPVDASPGFPLVRFGVWMAELKAALEVSAGYAYQSVDAGDYFLVPSGIRYAYDTDRPLFDPSRPLDAGNGRVTRIEQASDHADVDRCDRVLFDAARGWMTSPMQMVVVVTDLYVASFAASLGVTLREPDGSGTFASPADAILRRPDGSEVKDWQALAAYVRTASAASGGSLPSRYDAGDPRATFPRRAVCSGSRCGK